MSRIAVLGAGAFGTALALALVRNDNRVTLWARDAGHLRDMKTHAENRARLPGHTLPQDLELTHDIECAARADLVLLALPTQALAGFLTLNADHLAGKTLIACCKGIDVATGKGPSSIIADTVPSATTALLSGPSFAVDIAKGLPTALTIASADETAVHALQQQLSTPTLRLYSSTDVTGVETGGALKNVIAVACGITIGAGLGESARAALMTRGNAEMIRLAISRGARPETLAGLSGFGDLVLTCSSEKSRNYAFGLRLGRDGHSELTATTEGVFTAQAVAEIARTEGIDMPITQTMAAVLKDKMTVAEATELLMARPLRSE